MYIKNIKLQNYRNYENLNGDEGLTLGKKTTLLIGKNGAGKTNLITALKQSLSFIFTKSTQISQKDFVADTIQSIKSFETTDATRVIKSDGTINQLGSWPISIVTTFDIGEQEPLEVRFKRISLSEGMKELYSSASIRFWEKYKELTDLPVLVFYSDSFPHEKVTIGKKIQDLLNSEFGISQPAGYYNWDDPRDCGSVWQQFFVMQFRNFMYGNLRNSEKEYIEAIRDCMIKFSSPLDNADDNSEFVLDDIRVVARGKKDLVMLHFRNGMESDFESLPAGFRRAFSMAFDLANRAFILNKNCNPEGVAFIDEIDLHLHPSLAQEILERLQNTFPRMQFIVSTHSPLVVSNFKQNGDDFIVYRLQGNINGSPSIQKIDYSFGIDYNSLLVDLMSTRVRNSMLRKIIESYLYWKSANDEELMNSTLQEIIELVGEDSRIVKELTK